MVPVSRFVKVWLRFWFVKVWFRFWLCQWFIFLWQVAEVIAGFLLRHRFAQPKEGFERWVTTVGCESGMCSAMEGRCGSRMCSRMRVKCAVKAEMLHEHFLTYIFLKATYIRALKRSERFLKVQYAPHQGWMTKWRLLWASATCYHRADDTHPILPVPKSLLWKPKVSWQILVCTTYWSDVISAADRQANRRTQMSIVHL